jgi:sugar/nucleoside kinase (ribokinase family)
MSSLVVVGDVALDVVARHARGLAPGDDTAAEIRTTPGGAGANTARWLAHLGGRDRKSTRLNSSHNPASRMPSSA